MLRSKIINGKMLGFSFFVILGSVKYSTVYLKLNEIINEKKCLIFLLIIVE